MRLPLIQKYGSWEEVCNVYADKIKKIDPKIDKQKYYDWMMLQKNYSPSGYNAGMFMDIKGYYTNYLIYNKLKTTNQHHMLLISGKIGKGKSTKGLQDCALIDSTMDMEKICFVPPDLFKRFANCKPGESCLIDEGGNFFKGRRAMEFIGKDISECIQTVRELRQFLVICYDEPEKLDKDIIDKIDTIIIKYENKKSKGDKGRYRQYLGYSSLAADKVKVLLKDKVPIFSPEVLKLHSWRGHNSHEIPVINDIDEVRYKKAKAKHTRGKANFLYDKYKGDYDYHNTCDSPDTFPGWVKVAYKMKEEKQRMLDIIAATGKGGNTINHWINRYKYYLNKEKGTTT